MYRKKRALFILFLGVICKQGIIKVAGATGSGNKYGHILWQKLGGNPHPPPLTDVSIAACN